MLQKIKSALEELEWQDNKYKYYFCLIDNHMLVKKYNKILAKLGKFDREIVRRFTDEKELNKYLDKINYDL